MKISESQSELPLWGSGLENLGYTTQLPLIPRSTDTSPADIMDEDNSNGSRSQAGSTSTAEQKGWRFYISTIVSRRTSNDMLIDLWRSGEQHWLSNVKNVVDKTTEAVNVTNSWYSIPTLFYWCFIEEHFAMACSLIESRYQISRDSLPQPTPENQDLEFLVYGRHLVCLEKMYRPIIYVAVHYHTLPYHVQNNHPVSQQVFDHAQKALDTYAILIPNLWHHFRHQWIWNIMRSTFGAAIQIIAAVLSRLQNGDAGWCLVPPHNWPALIRMSIRTLKAWSGEQGDLDIMRITLERMYQGTCLLAGVRSDM